MHPCERRLRRWGALSLLAAVLVAAVASAQSPDSERLLIKKTADDHLKRLIQVTPRVYCGAEPKERIAFAELAKLGVTTLVCVDGSSPNQVLANRFGMRYVHIPIGYDRIRRDEGLAMVHVMRAAEGRVFVHCHHGRQRGPAMAAIAAIGDGAATPKQAIEVLRVAGTSNAYPGLWRDVARFETPPPNAKLPPLTDSVKVDALVRNMATLDRVWDEVKSATRAKDIQWRKAASNVTELSRLLELTKSHAEFQSEDFASILTDVRKSAKETGLAVGARDAQRVRRAVARIQTGCNKCHAQHRDQ